MASQQEKDVALLQAHDVRVATREKALSMAFNRGLEAGAIGAASGAMLSFAASKSQYAKYLSLSAKMSVPIMLGIFTFSVVYEQGIQDTMNHPERWGLPSHREEGNVVVKRSHHELPLYKKALNYLNDHPFTIIAGMGIPLASTILYQNMQLKHLTFSQKIMHSRVMAQGGVLAILLSIMGLKSFMDQHGGRFKEDDE